MPWVRIEAVMPQGPKFANAPSSVTALWLNAMCWTALNLTDGFIPSAQVYKLTNDHPRIVDAAVLFLCAIQPGAQSPAWARDPNRDGYVIHDYTDPEYGNPTRERMRALSEARSVAGRAGGYAKAAAKRQQVASPVSDGAAGKSVPPYPSPISPNGDLLQLQLAEDVETLCTTMQRLVEQRAKRPDITATWRTEGLRLLVNDERPLEEALAVMRWAAEDDFWRANVLSIPKLRKQYDRLKLKMESDRKPRSDVDRRVGEILRLPGAAIS